MADRNTSFAEELSAAFAWWQEAGVDCDFSDDVTDWLAAEPEPTETKPETPRKGNTPKPAAPVVAEKIDLLGPNPPADLAAFRDWWLSEPSLDSVGPRGRIPPRGTAGAELMILVVDPEQGDSESLLSQGQGRLLSRMLGAMGLDEDEVYIASALPRHTPMADGSALAKAGFSKVLEHHISLVAPKGVLAFGTNILPLLGHDAAQSPADLQNLNHDGRSVPLLASEGLDSMMAMPRLKARFWRRWLEWTGFEA